MKSKALEIRDEGTFIPVLAVDMNPTVQETPYVSESDPVAQRYLLRRCGYPCDGRPNIILTALDGHGKATNDPHEWGGRTYPIVHNYIIKHWEELRDGDVVDVSFILGETDKPKVSERITRHD
ncbi:MAG: hypothetical protein U1E51_16935 [Candidatus Binatia bacterium]|nr:hypothetical protein [Candidatus Binatia bacterium]